MCLRMCLIYDISAIKERKICMKHDFLEFRETMNSLEEIEKSLALLQQAFESKKNKVGELRQTSIVALNKIDAVIQKLEGVVK